MLQKVIQETLKTITNGSRKGADKYEQSIKRNIERMMETKGAPSLSILVRYGTWNPNISSFSLVSYQYFLDAQNQVSKIGRSSGEQLNFKCC